MLNYTMPRKMKNKKRHIRRGRKRAQRRQVKSLIGNRLTIFPPKLRIKQEFEYYGSIPAGAYQSGYFLVLANQAYSPLYIAGSNNFEGVNNNFGLPVASSSMTRTSQYYNKLAAIYETTRVTGSVLRVTPNPNSSLDNMIWWIVPYASPGALPATTAAMGQIPFCKQKQVFSSPGNTYQNTITCSASMHTMFGVSRKEVFDNANYAQITSVNSAPTNNVTYLCFWNVADKTNLANNVGVRIRLTNYTYFENLIESSIS